jgi:hypothetical protein
VRASGQRARRARLHIPRAATVFGRTGVGSVQTDGILQRVRGSNLALDSDNVAPRISEVVFIEEVPPAAQTRQHGHLVLVDLILGIVVEAHTDSRVTDRDRVQVRVGPAHRCLEDVMQLRHADAGGHQDPSPHGGSDLIELNMQLESELAGRS